MLGNKDWTQEQNKALSDILAKSIKDADAACTAIARSNREPLRALIASVEGEGYDVGSVIEAESEVSALLGLGAVFFAVLRAMSPVAAMQLATEARHLAEYVHVGMDPSATQGPARA